MNNTLVPRTIVRTQRKNAPVLVVNPFDKNGKLRVGQIISKVEELPEPCKAEQIASADIDVTDHGPQSDSSMRLPLDHLPSKQQEMLWSVLMSHKGLFDGDKSDIGVVPGIYHYIPTGDAAPIITRHWRLPQTAKLVIKEECQKMLKSNVIEPSTSPWMSPIVLVRKKDNNFRFCIDFRQLNSLTTSDSSPLPRRND